VLAVNVDEIALAHETYDTQRLVVVVVVVIILGLVLTMGWGRRCHLTALHRAIGIERNYGADGLNPGVRRAEPVDDAVRVHVASTTSLAKDTTKVVAIHREEGFAFARLEDLVNDLKLGALGKLQPTGAKLEEVQEPV